MKPWTWFSGLKLLWQVVIVVALLALLSGLSWKLFLEDHFRHNAEQKANAVVQQEGATATQNAGEAANKAIIQRYDTVRTIETITKIGDSRVQAVPHGDQPLVPGLDDAGRAALCMHDSYRAVNRCGLPTVDPASAAGRNAVG
jgi:hypothetical protein